MRKFLWAGQQQTSFNLALKNSWNISIFSRQIEHIKFDTGRDWKIIIKKKCEGKDVDFFYDINYMALATCRWLCNNNSNGGDGGGSKVWKMPAMGFKDSIIWPARPSSSYVLSASWCVKYSFFFLSFRFAGKFNSCGNSVNLKGAAASTHGNTRTRAKTRATPLATRPVCQQGSLYPFDRAA